MVLVFAIVNPIATASLTAFMGLVLAVLNRLIGIRVKRNSQAQITGNQTSLESARDLYGIKREAQTSGVIETWIDKFRNGRSQMANGGALTYTLNSLPRFVIETSLILGIFLFIGGVVIFSDIPSQAITIGVFLAGGLRVIAAVLPLQAAITQMREGSAKGQIAYETLLTLNAQTSKDVIAETSNETSTLSFIDVSYSYPDSNETVLNNISFNIEPLTKVAIVGPSGAGKSTIFDLAMGFLIPQRGEVLIGEQTTRSVLIGSPGTFGIVPQRPHLVSGSVLENVSLLADIETDVERVREVLIRAGLEKLTVNDDWQSQVIRPDSGQLSGGEIQRLSLARALYRNPKILFLDEATSALDAETELEITKVLDDLRKEMTVVLIAHRLSTVKKADKIIYLDKGEIIAQGSFSELKAEVKDFAKAIEIMGLED
jgi:ABC-type multidrug transport system fused ATPase/permease subunit